MKTTLLSRTTAAFAATIVWSLAWQTPATGAESRLKDVVTLQGFSPSPLVGYGLVVGLNKTGDKRQTLFSTQSLANMLSRFGVEVPGDQIKVENIAAVVVTGEMSPYQRVGARVDVIASSIGVTGFGQNQDQGAPARHARRAAVSGDNAFNWGLKTSSEQPPA